MADGHRHPQLEKIPNGGHLVPRFVMDTSTRNALIRQQRAEGASLEQIAGRHGMSRQQVWRVLNPRPKVSGMPCPKCGGSSRTCRTKPPKPDGIEREHQCQECGHTWFSDQTYRPADKSVSAHM